MSEFSNPLKWERVPVDGTDIGLDTYRALVDGKGWIVVMVPVDVVPGEHRCVTSVFVPDEGEMWGK